MSKEFKLERCADFTLWDGFIRSCSQGSVFARSWFLLAQNEKFDLYFILNKKTIEAGLIIFPENDGMKESPLPFAMYQGLILADHADKPIAKRTSSHFLTCEFMLEATSVRFNNISLCQHPRFVDIRPFLWFHYNEKEKGIFSADVRYTGWIDLISYENFDDFLNDLDVKKKREFYRCNIDGLQQCADGKVDEFLDLYQMTFTRQAHNLSDKHLQQVQYIISAALANDAGQLVTIRNAAGLAVAMNFILFDDHAAYYMFGANHSEHRDQKNGLFCMLAAIELSVKKNKKIFDMVGINSPGRGYFKTSFNANPTPYYILNWSALPTKDLI